MSLICKLCWRSVQAILRVKQTGLCCNCQGWVERRDKVLSKDSFQPVR